MSCLKGIRSHDDRLHPDKNPSDPTAPEKFLQISEAYTILGTSNLIPGNPTKRKEHDRESAASHPVYPNQSMRGAEQWSSRSYREKLRPEEWILHKGPRRAAPGYDYKGHEEGHYGFSKFRVELT